MIVLRSMLFSPGNNMRMLYKTGTLGADAVILDLEDAVPMADKETARLFVRDMLPMLSKQPSRVFVRVNSRLTGLMENDLDWVIHPGIAGIVLPKSESSGDVTYVAEVIEKKESARGMTMGSVCIVPLIETAKGVLAAAQIASANSRVVALSFGGVDFSRDMGVTLTRDGAELLYARAHIALAARAAGIFAVDTPWVDVADRDGMMTHAKTACQLGFKGKLLIHPSQVGAAHDVFSPSAQAIAWAEKVVSAFKVAQAGGLGAISLDGKMVDQANYQQAADLLAFAETVKAAG